VPYDGELTDTSSVVAAISAVDEWSTFVKELRGELYLGKFVNYSSREEQIN